MKKILFVIIVLVICSPSVAQNKAIHNESQIGNHLKEFSVTAQVGLGIMLAGTIVTAYPAIMPANGRDPQELLDKTKQLTKYGIFLSSVGTLTFILALNSTHKAGKLKQAQNATNLAVTGDGLTLKIPIN